MPPTDSRFVRFNLADLLERVDFYRGCFAIGFKRNSETPDAAKNTEASGRIADKILSADANKPDSSLWDMLSQLAPREMIAAAVDEVANGLSFGHCEAAFYLSSKGKAVYGDDHMLAVTTQQKAPVFIYPRKFNAEYEWVNIKADCNEIKAIVYHCFSLQGKAFQYGAMARCLTTPGPDLREKWFCSYLCATLLEFLSVPEGHLNRPNTLSVDDLYTIAKHAAYKPTVDVSRPAVHVDRMYSQNPLFG